MAPATLASMGRSEAMPFETAERERSARETQTLAPSRPPTRNTAGPSPRQPQPTAASPGADNVKIDIEQDQAQAERSDGNHGGDRPAKRDARVFAGLHERETEGREDQSSRRSHGR